MWERGLKLLLLQHLVRLHPSLPMWERGLKLLRNLAHYYTEVAPHVGAWIETRLRLLLLNRVSVAPHVGAWIET